MKYLSLFSGVGGFELGIQRAFELQSETERLQVEADSGGVDSELLQGTASCIGYSEIDKYAIQTYQKHFKEHENYGDATNINELELPDFDLLIGGFPCQAFSIAGKRKGFDEARGTLFFDIARILKHKRPRHFVLENVKGLLSHDTGKTFQTILKVLSDLGYGVEWQLLNAKDFGVPQNRERVFIIGHLRSECGRKVLPIRENARLDNPTLDTQEQEVQSIHRCLEATEYKGVSSERFTGIADGAKIRRLTPTECERLMSWPDGWTLGSDTQRYKQCGNGVVSNVVAEVITAMCSEGCLRAEGIS